MDLEIADYEKTVSSLNATIDERDAKITNLTTEVDSLEKRLDAMQNEVGKMECSCSNYALNDCFLPNSYFFPRTTMNWNNLPVDLAYSASLEAFEFSLGKIHP